MASLQQAYPQIIQVDESIMINKVLLSPLNGTAAYAKLRKQVSKAGILDRDYTFYAVSTAFVLTGFLVSVYFVIVSPVSWSLLMWAVALAFFAVQFGGFLHDAGHRAIFNSTKYNDIVGYFFGTLLAIGYPQWRDAHNVHHASTNVEDEDPDLKIPLHDFTVKRFQSEKGIWKLLRNQQAFVFFPMRTLVVYSIRLANIAYFKSQPITLLLVIEVFLWALGVFTWLVLPFFIFSLTKALILFFFVNTLMGLYISNVFAPNHKGMPQLKKGTKISFLEHQVLTSRNIKGGFFTDLFYFGLNYQIEHHLFPNCPRNKLKQITPYIIKVCREMNLPYTATGIWESNKIIIIELNRIVATAKVLD